MTLEELQEKISELISDYNRDLAYDEDDRVATARLHLTRPADRVGPGKPDEVFATPKEFRPAPVEGGAPRAAAAMAPASATSGSSSIQCCAVGWMGIVDSQGVFHACFPVAGACAGFPGPNRCVIP